MLEAREAPAGKAACSQARGVTLTGLTGGVTSGLTGSSHIAE